MRPVWKYSMAHQVWTTTQTTPKWHWSTVIPVLWCDTRNPPGHSPPQEHGTGAPSPRGDSVLEVMPSKHSQGCAGPVGSGAQPTSPMSTPRHCPPCCRGQTRWGERQRPAQDREHREHSSVITPHKTGLESSAQAAQGALGEAPKADTRSAVQN